MNKSESITSISKALVKAQSEMGNAVKDSKNPFFKSSFATLNAVREACIPVLNNHGIGVFQPTTVIDGKLYVETTLLHESGEHITGLYEVVTGKINDPQATGAAVSYARRYALQAMVNIGADDDDAESTMGRNKPAFVKNETKATVQNTAVTPESEEVRKSMNITNTGSETPKKGGFGVKKEVKAEVKPSEENGWE